MTPTLAEVLEGAKRAASRVASWPRWKREIGAPCVVPGSPGVWLRVGHSRNYPVRVLRSNWDGELYWLDGYDLVRVARDGRWAGKAPPGTEEDVC
jgi:hypothetical protein